MFRIRERRRHHHLKKLPMCQITERESWECQVQMRRCSEGTIEGRVRAVFFRDRQSVTLKGRSPLCSCP